MEPENGSNLNEVCVKFSRWFRYFQEGLSIEIGRSKNKIVGVFIKYRRKFQ